MKLILAVLHLMPLKTLISAGAKIVYINVCK